MKGGENMQKWFKKLTTELYVARSVQPLLLSNLIIIIPGAFLGGGSMWLLLVFLLLKTIVDLLIHIISHRIGQKTQKEVVTYEFAI